MHSDRREQEAAAGRLAHHLVIMSHEKPSDDLFQQSLGEINRRIFDFIHSSNISDKFGAVMAIDRIISSQDFEGLLDLNLARYANYLRVVLPSKDVALMRDASVCMGKIFARGGLEIADMVDFELNRIFQWLQGTTQHRAYCVLSVKTNRRPTRLQPVLWLRVFFSTLLQFQTHICQQSLTLFGHCCGMPSRLLSRKLPLKLSGQPLQWSSQGTIRRVWHSLASVL